MGQIFASILFPGLGHLLLGRYLKGAVLAVVFAVMVEALLVGGLVWPEPFAMVRVGLWCLAALTWLYGVVSVGREVMGRRSVQLQRRKDFVLMEGMQKLLSGDMAGAQRAFRVVLRLDDRDVEGWLYLGRASEGLGEMSRARRCYRAAGRLDVDGKWSWELGQKLSGSRRSSSRAAV